ncbi:muscle, skeletal receptor tyrosine-protein kinase [Nomia melanderi]|uniref:muscle, skeletal receptor tyrosine-protein kinase n=1 Tax=Nomia melanderi TaxID=2448451 RepID=UPI00130446EF|nr:BDNF/NT-3 growth factors receptor-like [Nomia melanderi]XP_031843456.1 BDNF/NT-3 growth factors receptor-like [Nomia melanderi]XP_031843457.1 BDNF/NT-3 growth factors receptor-like [Nomia melanderi]XP_031843458.1 BDNF/NT-3 growth factors receptor-like [Nomia melanderi]XP_031843459.1 BDNF/NT-3 growth factors receptor-like [Nomia melanderi]
MERRRVPRRRGLSSAENRTELSVNATAQQSEVILLLPINGYSEITGCKDRPYICGKEAACRSFKNNTSTCVCPHDLSPPTNDLKCPNRLIVPLTPRPIPNIIPPNGNSTNGTTALPEAEQVERSRQRVPEIIGIVLAFIAVLVILLSIVYCVRKRSYNMKSQRNSLDGTPMNLKKGLLLANKYTPNPQYFSCASPEVPIVQRESLIFVQDIGEGCFGKVYKGELCVGDSKEIVAIKVLKDSASREVEEDFIREVDIMSTFRHSNILSLKGIVPRDPNNSPWMVFEYMPYGDLAEVLRSNTQQFRSSKPGLQPLTQESLHWITIQIAAGMTYLSGQRFVHRDLACRNCLVGSDLVVKIADFGMSRDVYTCDYYKIGGSRLLPVRWMSPESVMYGRFTLESDVWSFGVVLWEVYSFGKQPYYGHNNEEVVKLIFQGIMLIPPEGCPPFVCQLMRDCWKTDPKDRIKFAEILEKLEIAQGKSIQQGTLPRPPQGPVTIRTPDVLDPDGYLLPAPAKPHEYLQTLPAISD